jgi:nicotinamidase-related amidase
VPLDLSALIAPSHTAVVTSECQRGVVGDLSNLPALAEAASAGMLDRISEITDAARRVSSTVVHCTAERRADGLGANQNSRLFKYMSGAKHPLYAGTPAAEIVPEIDVLDDDMLIPRLHGLSPFQGTELDFILRNLGVKTIVATGVSVNVAIQALTYEAVSAGYQVVIPRDAVAGFPKAYADMVFEHSLGAIASVVSTADILDAWS